MLSRMIGAHAMRCCRAAWRAQTLQKVTSSSAPLIQNQVRRASILSNLSDNKGAYNKRIRVGRGPSSGYGKTAGRGQKGRKARGKVKPWFQGGQTPLIVSHGRKGFLNLHASEMAEVNLDRIQQWINAKRLDPTKPITPVELIRSRCAQRNKDGIKLLARGKASLSVPIHIIVSRASTTAIEAVERAGGTITTRYYTKESLRHLLQGKSRNTDKPLPFGAKHVSKVLQMLKGSKGEHYHRLPDPTSRRDIEYYRDPAHRGYLSHTLKPGESPSLYWKVPGEKKMIREKTEIAQGDGRTKDTRMFRL